jgi:Tat protein translocase TatB subunit
MFGTLGGQEIILILVLALIVFGPRKLPEIGKSIGRMMAEFRKASNDFRRTLEDEVEAEKLRPVESTAPPVDAPPETPAATPAYAPYEAGTAPPAEASAPEAPRVTPPSEPTEARAETAGVGRPDGRPAE